MKKFSIILLILSSLLIGCSKKEETNSANTQEINVSISGAIASLDSVQSTDINSSDMLGQLVEGLYRVDKNGAPELALAKEEPKVAEEGTSYTFTLKDTQWSNGEPLTAKDFVFAFQQTVDPKTNSSSADKMDIFKNAKKIRQGELSVEALGVQALDDQTLVLILEQPISYLSQILVGTHFMPQNEKFVRESGQNYGTSSKEFIGNGPFIIKDWDGQNENWLLEKNKFYWDAKNVKLDAINVQVIKEVGTGVKLFDDGQLDYTLLSDVYVEEYAESEQRYISDKSVVGYLSANQKREVTGNVHFRKAILQAIDKENYVKAVLADGSSALNGYIPKNFSENPITGEDFRKENGELLPFDVVAAKKEWEQAKKELGKESIELQLLCADTANAKKTAEFIQGQLEDCLSGFSLTIKSIPLSNRLELQNKGEFDLVFATWTPDFADPIDFLNFYESNSGLNTAGYADEEYDAGLSEAQELINEPEKRWQKLLALEKKLVQTDTTVLPIYQGATAYLKSDKLKGLQLLKVGRSISYRMAYVKED